MKFFRTIPVVSSYSFLKSYLKDHLKNLNKLCCQQNDAIKELSNEYGNIITKLIQYNIVHFLRKNNIEQFKTKNKKIKNLTKGKNRKSIDNCKVPIINLSNQDVNTKVLEKGLHHIFINKNKYIQRDLAVELESLAERLDNKVLQENKECFHEFLRGTTSRFSQNIYHSKDNYFRATKELRENKSIVILSGDKD